MTGLSFHLRALLVPASWTTLQFNTYYTMGGVQSGEGGRHGFHVLKVRMIVKDN
jgi:hypothetical protein